jgi:hypothetical protein
MIGIGPAKYQTLLSNYSTGQVTSPTKFREMIDRMCDLQKHHQNVEDAAKLKKGKEISLTSVGTGFAGTCFTCKKKGHEVPTEEGGRWKEAKVRHEVRSLRKGKSS